MLSGSEGEVEKKKGNSRGRVTTPGSGESAGGCFPKKVREGEPAEGRNASQKGDTFEDSNQLKQY